MNTDTITSSLKRHEGFRSRVYNDSLGIPTIGYGFAIKDLVLSESISSLILKDKVSVLVSQVMDKFPWLEHSPENIQSVIVEMCYQLGVTGVSHFKNTLKAMEERRWSDAANGMLDSKWAKQTPSRAKEMSEIVRETI